MSTAMNSPLRRSLAGLSAGLLLATLGTVALASTAAAAPPEPSATIDLTCDNTSGDDQSVHYPADVAYKGRWVTFVATISVDSTPKPKSASPDGRWDSTATWPGYSVFTTGTPASSATIEIQVLDKGDPVGNPFKRTVDCSN
jgi:hypothetical protein